MCVKVTAFLFKTFSYFVGIKKEIWVRWPEVWYFHEILNKENMNKIFLLFMFKSGQPKCRNIKQKIANMPTIGLEI